MRGHLFTKILLHDGLLLPKGSFLHKFKKKSTKKNNGTNKLNKNINKTTYQRVRSYNDIKKLK